MNPNAWNEKSSEQVEKVAALLDELTEDQRLEVFVRYCCHCGSKDPGCQCWNDE